MYQNLKKLFSLKFIIALCCVAPAVSAKFFTYSELTAPGVLQQLVAMKIVLPEGIKGCGLAVEQFIAGDFGGPTDSKEMVGVINSMISLEKYAAEIEFKSACERSKCNPTLPVLADEASVSMQLKYINKLRARAQKILHRRD